MKKYTVKYIDQKNINIDGHLSNPIWRQANLLTDFRFPWITRVVPATQFRAFYTADHFYFSFNVVDDDIVLLDTINDKMDIINEDRVEMFFSLDPELKQYYCFEIDAKGRVQDNATSFYRKFNRNWQFEGMQTKASINDDGYIVEGSIPIATFKSLGFDMNKGQELMVGVFRAEFNYDPSGKVEQHWLSWIDAKTAQPDFHVPSAFGRFYFE